MFNFRPRALYALAKAFRMPWRSSAECAAITLSSAYCNSVIVVQLTLLLALNLLSLKSLPYVLYMIGIPRGSSSPMWWTQYCKRLRLGATIAKHCDFHAYTCMERCMQVYEDTNVYNDMGMTGVIRRR